MDNLFFKLVCVDENNPIEYHVLYQKNFDDLEKVHDYVEQHVNDHDPEFTKWMLLPFKKSEQKVS